MGNRHARPTRYLCAPKHADRSLNRVATIKYLLLTLLLAVACDSAAASYSDVEDNLPTIGDPANQVLTPREEAQLGRELLTQLRRELPILDDVELNYYLSNLGARLLNQAGDVRFPFHFLILEDPTVNAFAAPGGVIVVHTGLIDLAQNENQLAAVLAHEIAHVTQRHLARFYQKASKVDIGTTLGILAAIIASSQSPALGQAALYTGLAANASAKLAFTRANEREADRIGRQILAGAGFDPLAMSHFFERLREISQANEDSALEFLQTHPLPSARIADQFSVFDRDKARPKTRLGNSLGFKTFQARTRGLAQGLPGQTANAPEPRDSIIFARAVALLKNDRPDNALTALASLTAKWKTSLSAQLLTARALVKKRKYRKAIRRLQTLYPTHPDNPALLETLITAWIAAGDAAKAYSLIGAAHLDINRWPPLVKLKAAAASRAGHPAISHATMATYYMEVGLPSAAMAQIEIAEALPVVSKATRAKLKLLKSRLKDQEKK